MEMWLVILFLSRKKFHAKQIYVLSSSMKLGPERPGKKRNVYARSLCYQNKRMAHQISIIFAYTKSTPKNNVTDLGSIIITPKRKKKKKVPGGLAKSGVLRSTSSLTTIDT